MKYLGFGSKVLFLKEKIIKKKSPQQTHKKKPGSLKFNSISPVPCFDQMPSHHKGYIPTFVYTELILGDENK